MHRPTVGSRCGPCPAGLYCGADKRCRAPGEPGDACAGPGECLYGLVCASGSCAAPLAVGAACGSSVECGPFTYCREGRCVPCERDEECATGCDPHRGCVGSCADP